MRTTGLTIERVEHLKGHALRFHFSDGRSNEVDFKPWIAGLPTEEEHAYLKPSLFKQHRIHFGHAIVWGDYDIIFPLVALYHGDPELIEAGEPVTAPKVNVRVRRSTGTVGTKTGKSRSPRRTKTGQKIRV